MTRSPATSRPSCFKRLSLPVYLEIHGPAAVVTHAYCLVTILHRYLSFLYIVRALANELILAMSDGIIGAGKLSDKYVFLLFDVPVFARERTRDTMLPYASMRVWACKNK